MLNVSYIKSSENNTPSDIKKFVSDLRQVDGFPPSTPVSSTNKTDRHDITEILLKVALNTIKQTNTPSEQFRMITRKS